MTLTIAGGPWLANVVPALKFQNQIEGQSPRDSTNTKKQGDRSCKTNKILQSRSGVFDGLVEKDAMNAMRCTEGFRTFNKITQGRISSPLADKTRSLHSPPFTALSEGSGLLRTLHLNSTLILPYSLSLYTYGIARKNNQPYQAWSNKEALPGMSWYPSEPFPPSLTSCFWGSHPSWWSKPSLHLHQR